MTALVEERAGGEQIGLPEGENEMKTDMLSHFDLAGKIAAITRGGGELCGDMAEAFGSMGVKVAVLDIDLQRNNGQICS